VCSAGIDIKAAKMLATVSATFAAEFEGTFAKGKACAQFQLTTKADGTLDASFFWWAWTRRMTLKALAPIKLCGTDNKQECIWDIGTPCPKKKSGSMSAVDSGQQLDDYYHNL